MNVLFWILAICTVGSATLVVSARNPIRSAMALVASFFFLAGIYVLLLAHTIAVLQIIVYAGAIMVLFLFVIMLLSITETGGRGPRITFPRVLGTVSTVGLFVALAVSMAHLRPGAVTTRLGETMRFGTLQQIGGILYTQWLLPFEAVSLLLLVAIVGAVVVAKSRV